jgi:Tfp pilus assembly PilM family ATPase
MANPKRTVLGVEIGTREVRMVEMRGGGVQPQILKAGSVPLPPGAMDGDRIVQVEVVADLVRGLHSRLGCQAKAAIVGMGVQSVVTRILAIPRVPDSELRTVIEGELAHYQILQAGTGAFDFFRMDASTFNADSLPSVLLMAVDERTAQGYRLTIEKAGLQMLALEPISLSLFRAAYPMLETEPAVLCLAITPPRSELSILDHTQLRLYRRLDIGSNDFIAGRRGSGSTSGRALDLSGGDTGPLSDLGGGRGGRALNEEESTAELTPSGLPTGARTGGTGPLPPMGIGNTGDIIPQAAATLANEIQRSLDYYRREYPNSTAIGRIILTTNDPEVEGLTEWLAEALRMDVRVVEPPTDPSLPPQTVSQLESPQGLRFLGAAGLALHALTPDWKQVPRFNLATGTQGERIVPVERDKLTASMVLSIGLLVGGFGFAWWYHTQSGIEQHRVEAMTQALIGKQKDYKSKFQEYQDENTLAGIIKSDNLPVPGLLDILAGTIPPNVGLTSLTFDRKGKISLEGKAKSLTDFNIFYLQLNNCTQHLMPPRLGTLSTDPQSHFVKFTVDTALRGTHAAQEMGEAQP